MVQFSANNDSSGSLAPARLPQRVDQRDSSLVGRGRIFTRESANRVLPLVKRVTADLLQVWRELQSQQAQMQGIETLHNTSDIRVFSEELACVKADFQAQNDQLDAFQQELSALGVMVDSLADGAFDFPAYDQRNPIRLCWQVDEPEVTHWHGVDETFRQRRRLDTYELDEYLLES